MIVAAWPLAARAQQGERIRLIALISPLVNQQETGVQPPRCSSLSLDASYRSSFRAAADALATHVGARLFATRVRPWGFALGTGGDAFCRAICDLGAGGGLFRVGNPHERLVDAHTFQEEWRVLA